MHIKGFGGNWVPPLQSFGFDCNERVNLFVGPNASGKSTILRAIAAFYSLGSEETPGPESHEFANSQGDKGFFYMEPSDDWPRDPSLPVPDQYWSVKWGTVPLLYIPATRVNLPSRDIFDSKIYDLEGVTSDAPLKGLSDTASGIFYGQYVEETVGEIQEATIVGQRVRALIRNALEIGYSCARDICREVVHDDRPHTYVELDGDDSQKGRIAHYGMGIGTSDDVLGEPLYVGVLSSGTQGTFLWVWALAIKMLNHYDWAEDWQGKPAILLIDEIENHLHPTWQRRVIPALLAHFPGLQIFATTHSPFVVAGLKAGQVHLLKRDENGVVTATTNTEDIIGWTADEILRTMMGVDEPTDQLTVDRANRLRELREKDTLTTEEQDELNTLRRQVNQTFLNKSSPLEAQRERYSELMQQFLLSRQSDLSQDGG